MVVRIVILVVFLLNAMGSGAQAPKFDVLRKGLLRGHLSISPGLMLNSDLTNIYLNGGCEYLLGDRISFAGNAYWFINSQQKGKWLKNNSSVMWGFRYHFPVLKKKLDTYIGFEPGVGFVQASAGDAVSTLKPTPLLSGTAGIAFHVWKIFNFFAEARYVYGEHSTAWNETYKLDEIRISAGLGWNLNLIRKKKE